jgi:hypothetical protein
LYHAEVAQAAIRAGLDFLVMTDHNVWVQGVERYHMDARPQGPPRSSASVTGGAAAAPKRVLLLAGERFDRQRTPKAATAWCTAPSAADRTAATREAARRGGDRQADLPGAPLRKPRRPSARMRCPGLTGTSGLHRPRDLELHVEFKAAALSGGRLALSFRPRPASGPFAATLAKWDLLLAEGRRVVGIGGADAHGLT